MDEKLFRLIFLKFEENVSKKLSSFLSLLLFFFSDATNFIKIYCLSLYLQSSSQIIIEQR